MQPTPEHTEQHYLNLVYKILNSNLSKSVSAGINKDKSLTEEDKQNIKKAVIDVINRNPESPAAKQLNIGWYNVKNNKALRDLLGSSEISSGAVSPIHESLSLEALKSRKDSLERSLSALKGVKPNNHIRIYDVIKDSKDRELLDSVRKGTNNWIAKGSLHSTYNSQKMREAIEQQLAKLSSEIAEAESKKKHSLSYINN